VLMLPVVRSEEQSLRGGLAQFFRRRAWRILPPYYVAQVIAGLLSIAFHRHDTISNFLAHIFLIHNIRQAWEYGFDVPMWSVAVEWQIYFIFALLLIPIWKRFGALPTLTTAFTIGLGIHFLTHGHFDRSSPWYLGLFALGMLAAEINYSRQRRFISLRNRLPSLPLSALFALCFLGIEYTFMIGRLHFDGKDFQALSETWAMDLLVGLAATCLIIGCTHHLTDRATARPPYVLRLLNSRLLVFLGTFSYSYYLIHVLVLGFLRVACDQWRPSALLGETLQLILGIPLALVISYGFYLVAERPLQVRPERKNSSG
jgi:peptidoglycan/LPS O-acetylase OafA/YrhL